MRVMSSRAAPAALGLVGVALFAVSPALAGTDRVHAAGPLTVYAGPAGGRASVDVAYDAAGSTRIGLGVSGLERETRYAVRVHHGPCPPPGAAPGPVYQRVPPPEPELADDPAFRNPRNEVWLDVSTGADGAGRAHARQDWQFPPQTRPESVIIHRVLLQTVPTDPVVGRPLACLEVSF